MLTPRDYQQAGIDDIVRVLEQKLPATLNVSPTGSGKSVVIAGALIRLPTCVATFPNQEIALGVYEKLTGDTSLRGVSEAKQRRACEKHRLFTVKRALSLAGQGELICDSLLHDEAHHGTDDTHDSLRDLLGRPPFAGVTATAYRGTPAETAKLRSTYPGGIVTLLSLKSAVERKVVALPLFHTLPLLDDETIDVSSGEFVVKSVESAIKSRLGQLVEVLKGQRVGNLYQQPTTVVLGSVGAVSLVAEACELAGLPTVNVLAATKNRQAVFEEAISRRALLLQIRAVGEGVDLPLRRMYDLSPTMSPVLWMQRVGRIMRPWWVCGDCGTDWWAADMKCAGCLVEPTDATRVPKQPTYFSCCHNLMRHGYLFEGLIPRAAFAEARAAWGSGWKPSRRSMARALGNTGFGRFLPTEVPLLQGGALMLYALKAPDGLSSYAAMLIPHASRPVYFARSDTYTGKEATFEPRPGVVVRYPEKLRGRWRRIRELPELVGCVSYPPEQLFPSMGAKWSGGAEARGLDPKHIPDRKQYLALSILEDTGLVIS